jgi:hypothetical protein
MKTYATILLGFIATLFIYWCIPKSCTTQPSELENKAIASRKADSLLTIVESKHQAIQDSIIRESNKKDSIAKVKIAVLQKGYNEQRAIIKHLTTIRIDSVGQVVNNVPIEEYNALIEAGNKCDSMLTIERERIAEKDTTIKALNNKFESERKLTESAQNKANDFLLLAEDEKKQKDKAKKANNILKKVLIIETGILIIMALIL